MRRGLRTASTVLAEMGLLPKAKRDQAQAVGLPGRALTKAEMNLPVWRPQDALRRLQGTDGTGLEKGSASGHENGLKRGIAERGAA